MTTSPLETQSFDASHHLLRWFAVKHFFAPISLSRNLLLQWCFNGGLFTMVGGAISHGLTSSIAPGAWIGWGAYLMIALLITFEVFELRGSEHGESTDWSKFWVNAGPIIFHQAVLLVTLVLGASLRTFFVVEMVWFGLWCSWMVAGLYGFDRPLLLSCWKNGFWQEGSEKEMVLDCLYHEHKKPFALKNRQRLWDTLPEWKWELHAFIVGSRAADPMLLRQLEQWMELEKNPLWEASKLIHGHDIAASVATFLKMRTQPMENESYALPL